MMYGSKKKVPASKKKMSYGKGTPKMMRKGK